MDTAKVATRTPMGSVIVRAVTLTRGGNRGSAMRLSALSGTYLAQLEGSDATRRQRRWALDDLAAFAGAHLDDDDPPAERALANDLLTVWLATPQSTASVRAKAGAVRALTAFAADRHLVDVGAQSLRRPVAPPATVDQTGGRLLLAAATEQPPFRIPARLWLRFAAHVHLLAATGAREDALAALRVDDVSGSRAVVDTARIGPVLLDDPARHAVTAWLVARADVTATLEGSDPTALWIRLRPGTNRRTGALAPAGLAISARGLRLAYTTIRDALGVQDPRVATVHVRDVRALGRPAPGSD